MKGIAVILPILILPFFASSQTQTQTETQTSPEYKVALGIRLSNASPTLNNSVSLKYFLNHQNALEGLVSFGSRFGMGALYEIHNPTTVQSLRWFYGGGAYVGWQNGNTHLGPTGIIGLDYKFTNVPLNLSVDWKPELDLLPSISFIPDAFAISARFTF